MKLKVLVEEVKTDKKEPEVVIDSTIHGAEPAPYVDAVVNSEKNKKAVADTVASITPKEPVTGRVEKDDKLPESSDLKAMKLESFKKFLGEKYKDRFTENVNDKSIIVNIQNSKEVKELVKESFKENLSYDLSKVIVEDASGKTGYVFTVKESLANPADGKRVIHTGLTHQLDKEVLDSVLGQMSDGIWEDSPSMEKYWGYVDFDMIDGELCIVVDVGSWKSGFRDMDDDDVKKYFATKIKQVVKEEINDGANIEWVRNSKQHLDYMHDSVTVGDCYRVYDALLERQGRSESPDVIVLKMPQELKAGDKTEDGKIVKSVEAEKVTEGRPYWQMITYEDGSVDKFGESTKIRILKEAVKEEVVIEAKTEDEVKTEESKVETKVEEPSANTSATPTLPGPQTDQDVGISSMLNEDIIGEWRTIDIYNSHIASINALLERHEMDEKVGNAIKDILIDINNEENVHIGQLQKALSLISLNVNSIAAGEKEAKEKIAETKPEEVKSEVKVEEPTKENK